MRGTNFWCHGRWTKNWGHAPLPTLAAEVGGDCETTRRKKRSKPTRHFAIIGFANEENEDRETTRRKTRSKPTRHFAIIGSANEDYEAPLWRPCGPPFLSP